MSCIVRKQTLFILSLFEIKFKLRDMRRIPLLLLSTLLFASCSSIRYAGVNRVREYSISSPDVPEGFDGYRIAFASDFHLRSKFKERQLHGTVKALQAIAPDMLLLGGDYQEGCEYVAPLFIELGSISTPDGTYAVLGNNDYERCTDLIRSEMQRQGINLLEDATVTIHRDNDSIVLWGANAYAGRYPTAQQREGIASNPQNRNHKSKIINPTDFIILLTHTPDYVEDADVSGVDLALAGHTHGGQVTLFGLYAPITASKYGTRFRTGLRRNSQGVPIIISGGLGTSRRNIRFCAPTDIIIVTLRRDTTE